MIGLTSVFLLFNCAACDDWKPYKSVDVTRNFNKDFLRDHNAAKVWFNENRQHLLISGKVDESAIWGDYINYVLSNSNALALSIIEGDGEVLLDPKQWAVETPFSYNTDLSAWDDPTKKGSKKGSCDSDSMPMGVFTDGNCKHESYVQDVHPGSPYYHGSNENSLEFYNDKGYSDHIWIYENAQNGAKTDFWLQNRASTCITAASAADFWIDYPGCNAR